MKIGNIKENFALISGHRPENSERQNDRSHLQLKRDLDGLGADYTEQNGEWEGEEERSLAVTDIPRRKAKRLGKKYRQDAVMHKGFGQRLDNVLEAIDFESMFGSDDFKRNTIVARGEPKIEPYVLTLYRGFTVDVANLERQDGYYILSPEKSEQGLIWFTHDFIRGYNPIEYVQGRGTHILTYPLECLRHTQELQWSDGTTSTTTPPEFDELVNPFENCRYHMGLELPEGWVFSYKTEKFVGCEMKLKISPDMLENDPSF